MNGTVMFGAGDSGGPIYRLNDSGGRVVVGIVEGAYNVESTVECTTYYGSGRRCSIINGRITAISTIMTELRKAAPDFFARTTS